MNISAWAIRNPIPTIVLFVILTSVGLVSFSALPITDMPNIDVPVVSIQSGLEGASANEIEIQITKRIEAAIAGLSDVLHVTSSIGEGSSVTTVEFRIGTLIDRAISDVRDAVANIRGDLPQTARDPIVQRVDVEGGAIVTYAVSSSTRSAEELSWFVDDEIARTLQGISGIAQVTREGGATREIKILLDNARLQALGMTVPEINRQVRETNIDRGGGRGHLINQEQTVRLEAGAKTIEGLANTRIVLPGGTSTVLADIAEIADGSSEQRMSALHNGEPIVTFGIFRAKGYSDPQVAEQARRVLSQLSRAHPDINITLIDDRTETITDDYNAALTTLIEGACLAIIVVQLFLRDIRATVISSFAIPLSILPTFIVLQWLGFSLNTITLLAVTLVTGVLVDDAIVEIENIARHRRMGKSPYQAAMDAADEIGLAVLATTSTVMAVFLPVSFMGGIAGQYFKQFGVTVAVAVFFSFLVARLLTPLMAAYFLAEVSVPAQTESRLTRLYSRILRWTTRRRYLTAMAGLGLFAASVLLTTLLPSGLLPSGDNGRSELSFELPPGVTIAQAQNSASQLSSVIAANNEVDSVYVTIGQQSGDEEDVFSSELRKGKAIISLKPRAERGMDQKTFEEQLQGKLSQIPDLRSNFATQQGGRDFSIVVSGNNDEDVDRTARDLRREIQSSVPLLQNISSSAAVKATEIKITPDINKASLLGVSPEQIAEAVRVSTIGDVSRNLAKFSVDGRQLDIRVQLDNVARRDPLVFENIQLRAQDGTLVSLASIADITFGIAPTSIDRYDRERRVLVEADLAPASTLEQALDAVLSLPVAKSLPSGVTIQEFGDAALMAEVFSAFTLASAAGVLLVFAVLVVLFSSFLQPITILLSLPLSIFGAVVALLATGHALNIPVIIGFLMLTGIVGKNAILLVDFTVVEINKGRDRIQAVIEAGCTRAQPIVMTTFAMIAGMIPSAISSTEGGAFRAPMAIAVIGGLLTSTFLSLILVPSLFLIIDDMGTILRKPAMRLLRGMPKQTASNITKHYPT